MLGIEDVNEYSKDEQNLDTIDKEDKEISIYNNEDDLEIAVDDFNVATSETNNNSMIIDETKESKTIESDFLKIQKTIKTKEVCVLKA